MSLEYLAVTCRVSFEYGLFDFFPKSTFFLFHFDICDQYEGISLFFFCLFVCFRGSPWAYRSSPSSQARGSNRSYSCRPELQLPAYATATAMRDPSCICNLHHSSGQCQILNPLSEARVEPTSSWILVRFVTTEPGQEL